MKSRIDNTDIEIIQGDITDLAVDAVVNAANKHLVLGGGVAGAIRQRGGPSIQKECDAIGGTFTGGAVITSAGALPARHVIHAVGPVNGEGDEDAKLASATRNSFKLALENGLRSIAFPAISTGIFGFPVDRCARVMLREAVEHARTETAVELVIFCLYDAAVFNKFKETLLELTSGDSA